MPVMNIAGEKYGRLTAVRCVGTKYGGSAVWEFACDCGRTTTALANGVRSGRMKSCGCIKKEYTGPKPKHGHAFKGKATSEYATWSSMIGRCTNPKNKQFPGYGGRGITVCERWLNSFSAFIADMGLRQSPRHTLDRIDNSRGYEPGNCRWATIDQQSRNKRNNIWLTYLGMTMCLTDWARRLRVPKHALHKRIRGKGLDFPLAIEQLMEIYHGGKSVAEVLA